MSASDSLEVRSALQAHGDQLDTELRLLRELPQVYLTEKCIYIKHSTYIARTYEQSPAHRRSDRFFTVALSLCPPRGAAPGLVECRLMIPALRLVHEHLRSYDNDGKQYVRERRLREVFRGWGGVGGGGGINGGVAGGIQGRIKKGIAGID